MKKLISIVIFFGLVFSLGWWASSLYQKTVPAPSVLEPVIPKPLEKYTIENLSTLKPEKSTIEIGEVISEEDDFTSYLFSFEFKPTLQGKETKKTTGQLNIPNEKGSYPLVLMLRGYVDQEIYQTGIGTRKAAEVFANNGFITIAPDFLGYGGSDMQNEDIFEARFQTYATTLALLESLDSIPNWDKTNVFIWGHSNGGQIALTVLEITGKDYPTTLWAPVSKSFPYSILYYTDESEDRGKYIRRELAKFENLYDVDLFSIDRYFERINAPLQIHQGSGDDAVPVDWTNELVEKLDELEKENTYYTYSGADHNMVPVWNTVVARDLNFFKENIDK
ncbi:MAG: prolyl oligopeptidase family serine peptidase [Patescibacteria group bacterium]